MGIQKVIRVGAIYLSLLLPLALHSSPSQANAFFDCWQALASKAAKLEYSITRRSLLLASHFVNESELLPRAVAKSQWRGTRDIESDQKSQDFLARHKIYISLTTSPERISKVHWVLESLDWRYVEKVILSIPLRFARDGGEYSIPGELLNDPRILILRPESDDGPATKLLPAAAYLQEREPESVVITVDDDTLYPVGMIRELIWVAARRPGHILGSMGHDWSHWDIPATRHLNQTEEVESGVRITPVDVLEGFGGILYWTKIIPIHTIRSLSQAGRESFLSDDLTISRAHELAGVPRERVDSPYYRYGRIVQVPYGFRDDALHRGAGMAGHPQEELSSKYRRAYVQMEKKLGVSVSEPEYSRPLRPALSH